MFSWANITTYEFALTVERHTIVSKFRVAYIEVVVLSNVQLGLYYYLRICFDHRTPYNSKFKNSLY